MIPDIIHYCWFGGKPLPPLAVKCIDSWRRFMPGCEIRCWTDHDFDLSAVPYAAGAYSVGKYAFVSDYARFLILYNEGGIYFDTDVELLRSVDPLLAAGPFMGMEVPDTANGSEICVAPGLGMAMEAGNEFCSDMLQLYSRLSFFNSDGSCNLATIGQYVTDYLSQHGLRPVDEYQVVHGIQILPQRFLCPKSPITGRLCITPDTYAIHHYAGSWTSPWKKMKKKVQSRIGPDFTELIINAKRRLLWRERTLRK